MKPRNAIFGCLYPKYNCKVWRRGRRELYGISMQVIQRDAAEVRQCMFRRVQGDPSYERYWWLQQFCLTFSINISAQQARSNINLIDNKVLFTLEKWEAVTVAASRHQMIISIVKLTFLLFSLLNYAGNPIPFIKPVPKLAFTIENE